MSYNAPRNAIKRCKTKTNYMTENTETLGWTIHTSELFPQAVTWTEVTEDKYEEMLGVLPPAAYAGAGFLVGEPFDHDPATGRPRYEAYRCRGGRFEVADRPLTRAEFLAIMR